MNWSQIILVKQQVYSVRLSTMKAFNRLLLHNSLYRMLPHYLASGLVINKSLLYTMILMSCKQPPSIWALETNLLRLGHITKYHL